ncbi:hypothetical protein ASF30_05340 [Leifsonia sp. Leaf264]|nr:hypothetical protein ASF30_05340 [Leifsonia sp. Leaf264]
MVMGTDDVISINDVPMTTASRTWCDLATLTTSTDELIMAGDRLLYWKEPLADRAGLSAAIVGHGHRRGARLLSAAFPELVDRSESPRKTLIRLAIIADGLPRPHLNFDLRDASGRLIARGDLAYPEYRMLLDYEGEQHRLDRSQWNRDLTRFNDIQDVDWYSMRIGSEHPLPEVVARIRAALLRRGWRP